MNDTRIAVVTGAGRGFGCSMARHLTAAGVSVIGTYNRGGAEARSSRKRSRGAAGELPSCRSMSRARSSSGTSPEASRVLNAWAAQQLDYFVNDAGICYLAPYPEATEEQFDELINVDLKAPYFLTQRLLPLLVDGGRILNLSTALTRSVVPTGSAYADILAFIDETT